MQTVNIISPDGANFILTSFSQSDNAPPIIGVSNGNIYTWKHVCFTFECVL